LSKVQGNRHAFSLDDASISLPYSEHETISDTVLITVSILGPAAIIGIVCFIFVPGPTAARGTPRSQTFWRKAWEANTGWLGLGVALSGAFMITQGLKDIYGKPRPDLLGRCQPDLSKLAQFAVGGLGLQFGGAPVVVDWRICKQTDSSVLSDGFASFPSGHASFSFAAFTYLTLFLCAKFAITIPFLAPAAYHESDATAFYGTSERIAARNKAAAPPLYLLVIAFIPLGVASYITGTRYSDYKHHGFDLVFGAILGAVFAWFGFRLYHLPIRQGAGWSWGPRTRDRAFYLALGVPTYVGDESWKSAQAARSGRLDLESGVTANGHGHGISDRSDASIINDRTNNIGTVDSAAHSKNTTEDARV
jgi:membrane-associated phospholipid phosphatase